MRAVLLEIVNKILSMNPTMTNSVVATMAKNAVLNYINYSMTDEEAKQILAEVKKILSNYNI